MATVQPINNSDPIVSAVKIRINKPKAELNGIVSENGKYNAVDIAVNEPEIKLSTFDDETFYPSNYYMPQKKLPKLPAPNIYQTINSSTLVNAEFKLKPHKKEVIEVPAPNFTTTEAEKLPYPEEIKPEEPANIETQPKSEISFKGNKEIEIVPPVEILPEINVPEVVKKLSCENYEEQAKQLEEIANAAIEGDKTVLPYVTKDIFHALIKILEKDSSELEGPSQEQQEIRKKIILNRIAEEKAMDDNQDMTNFKAPYEISDTEYAIASRLSPLESAERNKEYSIYVIAALTKTYINEYKEHCGNIVPFTDLPGVSNIVDTLKNNNNPGLKISAIDALSMIHRDEYKEELNSILVLATNDDNPYVAQKAMSALIGLNKE